MLDMLLLFLKPLLWFLSKALIQVEIEKQWKQIHFAKRLFEKLFSEISASEFQILDADIVFQNVGNILVSLFEFLVHFSFSVMRLGIVTNSSEKKTADDVRSFQIG